MFERLSLTTNVEHAHTGLDVVLDLSTICGLINDDVEKRAQH